MENNQQSTPEPELYYLYKEETKQVWTVTNKSEPFDQKILVTKKADREFCGFRARPLATMMWDDFWYASPGDTLPPQVVLDS
jgi:hypothetical protein